MKRLFASLLLITILFSSCRTKGDSAPIELPKENVELHVWNLFDDTDVLKGPIQAFESAHPNIKVVYKKFVDVEEYEKFLINEMAQGEGPDIFAIKNTWVDKHLKKIAPLPVGQTQTPMNEQIFEDTFFSLASDDLIRDHQIYAIPLYVDTLGMFYNKSVFRDNVPNTDKPAKTWKEIMKQSAQITKKNNSLERFSLSGISAGRIDNIRRGMDILSLMMLQNNIEFWNTAGDRLVYSRQRRIDPETKDSFFPFEESIKLFTSFANPRFKNYTWSESMTARDKELQELRPFLEGKVSMIFGYSYLYEELLKVREQLLSKGVSVIPISDIQTQEVPQMNNFAETGKRDALAQYFPLTVSRNSLDTAEAWELLLFLSNKENVKHYSEVTKKPSSRKDLVEEQMLDPLYGTFARQASYAKSFPKTDILDESHYTKAFGNIVTESLKNKKEIGALVQISEESLACQKAKEDNPGESEKDCF
ncbi:hypothetical protein COB57_05575 [Candidatus Peregrinibacteria bacterium]|nr:MAG: hypothetical protein COB57_05575 [Candidatus Peregrinibacteria bacterium]